MPNRAPTLITLAIAIAALPLARSPAKPLEAVIESFPVVVRAGLASEPEPPSAAERVLPDLPFSPERGYGYVGGRPVRPDGGAAVGGPPSWILACREGAEKYLFRVPNGEYLLELTFIETEVAAAGLRVFDVEAEGTDVIRGLDIAAEAGDFAWLTRSTVVPVRDGWLDLRFVSRTPEHPPRLSRIRIAGAADVPAPAAPGRLEAIAGPGRVALRWESSPAPGLAGYGVFGSDSAEGPFEALTAEPIDVPFHVERALAPGRARFYRVRALGAGGRESVFAGPVSGVPFDVSALGLRVMDLRVSDEEMRRGWVSREDPVEAYAEVHSRGHIDYALVRLDTGPGRWRKKKSFLITPQIERNRRVERRKSIRLSAEPGDATLLRAMVSAEMAVAAGLATPAAEPVALLLNGDYQGVYLDLEPLDRGFRRRTLLDRVGLLARETRGDTLEPDWIPYGEQHGEEGNLASLTDFVHELNRLGEGEMDRFFEERFYLERYINRLAVEAVRGASGRTPGRKFLLKDSRNGKWEVLEEGSPDGALGIHDFELEPRAFGEEDARRLIFGRSLQGGLAALGGSPPSVLDTRFHGRPALRNRLLERIEALLAGPLSPESFDAMVDRAFARIRGAVLADGARWSGPDSARDAFLEGPSRLKAAHRARAEVLREAVSRERERKPPHLRLDTLAVFPESGDPWVLVRNVSGESVDLGEYRLCTVFPPRAPRAAIPEGTLVPGGSIVVRLPSTGLATLSGDGGFIALERERAGQAELEPSDILFYGRQTRGFLYARRIDASWAFHGAPWSHAAGTPVVEGPIVPPTYEFRHGVVMKKASVPGGARGGATIWLKLRADESSTRPARVLLRSRDVGAAAFQDRDLAWDQKEFQYVVRLEAEPERPRTMYYFVAVSETGLERAYPLAAPAVTYYLADPPVLKLNEVLPRPGRAPGALGEFIEVYNPGDLPVDIEGMFLSDSSRNPTRWRIPAGNVIPPKGFAVFYADGSHRGNHTSFKLSNSGEFLGLFGRMEEGNLLTDSIVFRGLRTGESWGASPDGSRNFRAWKDPTPGRRNMPKIPEDYRERLEAERRARAARAEPPPVEEQDEEDAVDPIEEDGERDEDEDEDEGGEGG
ncbi:MAG TPA: CotH kinase family protein [Planctomycetota bacterium]|nr:CotH kinase family protein [Planctomycetota bacterium]